MRCVRVQILRRGLQDAANAMGRDVQVAVMQVANSSDPACLLRVILRADAVTSAGEFARSRGKAKPMRSALLGTYIQLLHDT